MKFFLRKAAVCILIPVVCALSSLSAQSGAGPGIDPSPGPGALPSPAASPVAPFAGKPSPSPTLVPSVLPATGSLYQKYQITDLESMSLEELEIALAGLKLSTKGSKAELLDRLKNALSVPSPSPSPSPVAQSVGPEKTPAPGNSDRGVNQTGSQNTDDNVRVVTIESAGSASNFTLDGSDDSYIKLSGGVSLLVEDKTGNTKHHILADEIVFNRDKQVMTARGNVRYELQNGGQPQKFEGKELVFNLESSDAVFLDGVALNTQTIKGNALDFRIVGALITRTSKDLVILDRADLSSSPWDPPAYKVSARKIRILRPGEWAIEDAVLYVGRVPMFYIPFFFTPGDEIVFHPVSGYRSVEGAFIQTTTYLAGRKPETTQPFSLLQINSGATQGSYDLVPRGIFLEKVKNQNAVPLGDNFLKLIVDGYTNLGLFAALQGKFSDSKALQNFTFTTALGVSSALYSTSSGTYENTLYQNGIGITHLDHSHLFASDIPLRYAIDIDMTLKFDQNFGLQLKLPLLSDPTITGDILSNRSEDMDWGKVVGISDSGLSSSSTQNASQSRDSIQYLFAANLTPSLPSLSPFVTSLSFTSMRTSWNWVSTSWIAPPAEVSTAARSAEKKFYIPSDLVVPDLSVTVSGKLLQFPWPSPAVGPDANGKPAVSSSGSKGPVDTAGGGADSTAPASPELLPPWYEAGKKDDINTSALNATKPSENDPGTLTAPQTLPGISLADSANGAKYSLDYNVNPKGTLTGIFPTSVVADPTTLDLSPDNWRLDGGLSGTLNSRLDSPLGFATLSNSFNYSNQLVYPFAFSDTLSSAEVLDRQTKGGQSSQTRVSNTNTLSLSPLVFSAYFSGTQINYSLSTLLYQRKFSGMNGPDPSFSDQYFTWTKDFVTAHTAGATVAFRYLDFGTSFTANYSLPPTAEQISAAFAAHYGSYTLGISTLFKKNTTDQFDVDPILFTLDLPFVDRVKLSQTFKMDPDVPEPQAYTATLSLWDFSAAFSANKAYKYRFNGLGFVQDGNNVFQPSNLSFAYKLSLSPDALWKQRITTKVDANLSYTQNLLQVTGSTLTYDLTWALSIFQFMDLNFHIEGQNNRMYRYFPALSETLGLPAISLFQDLAKSFNFFNEADRRDSSFDMKSISLTMRHYLGDWQLDLSYTGSPIVKTNASTGQQQIQWNDSFSLSIAWKPIPEVRKDISVKDNVTTIQ